LSNAQAIHSLSRLLVSVRDAVGIWYNITSDVPCYDLVPAPNREEEAATAPLRTSRRTTRIQSGTGADVLQELEHQTDNATRDCQATIQTGSWPALCCNEDMNLIITEAQGLGRDFLWPPSHRRGTSNHGDVVDAEGNVTDSFCRDPLGHYGFPQSPPDPWSTWYDIVYGGVCLESHSNIIFSNGLLDPWSAAGVYSTDPTRQTSFSTKYTEVVMPGLFLQHINDRDLVALIMEYGGHHTDFMFSSEKDPPSIRRAREIEKYYIAKWIDEWWQQELSSH
jgi:hypothetical protein